MFVRDYLLKHGPSYSQEIWRALKRARMRLKIGVCSHGSFRSNYVYILRKLGLIERVRTEPASRLEFFPRVLYKIVAGREDDPRWHHPQKAFDARRGLGKRRYKRKP